LLKHLKLIEMQTAVEWLVEQLKINNYISDNAHWLIDDAKEMEEKQIVDAITETMEEMNLYESFRTLKNGKQYYNKTYKTK
jgi:hypothetical protein